MTIATLPLISSILGLILFYASKNNADNKEVGKILFFVGTLAFLLTSTLLVIKAGH